MFKKKGIKRGIQTTKRDRKEINEYLSTLNLDNSMMLAYEKTVLKLI